MSLLELIEEEFVYRERPDIKQADFEGRFEAADSLKGRLKTVKSSKVGLL